MRVGARGVNLEADYIVSRYIGASDHMTSSVSSSDYRALAEIRYRIRCFVTFSEASAREVGLEPQQHQLLLAIRGLAPGVMPTIRCLAERLQIQHNSAVELAARSVANGLVVKRVSERDRREVLLEIAPKGARLLEKLAVAHRKELRAMAPVLVEAVESLVGEERPAKRKSRES
jgi:DNA-binding MarR family transcriptional regulator